MCHRYGQSVWLEVGLGPHLLAPSPAMAVFGGISEEPEVPWSTVCNLVLIPLSSMGRLRGPKGLPAQACEGGVPKSPAASCGAVVPGGAPGARGRSDCVAVTENVDVGAGRLELNPGAALPSCVTWGKSATPLCLGLSIYKRGR